MSENYTVRWLISIGCCIVCWFFCIPMILLSLYKFNKLSDTNEHQKRLPKIVNYLCKLGVIVFLFEKPLIFITYVSPLMYTEPEIQVILTRISHILLWLLSHTYIYLMAYRYWLLFYKLHLSEWKCHLNPHLHLQDFWLKYEKTIGSKKYCFIIFFIIYCMLSIPLLILLQIYLLDTSTSRMLHFIDTLLYLLPMLFIIILKYKLPPFTDIFYIRYELKIISNILIITCLFNIICVFLSYALLFNFGFLSRLLCTFFSCAFYFSCSIVLTLIIVVKFERNKGNTMQMQQVQTQTPSTHSYENIALENDICSLPQILSNTESFEIFVLYLIEEFSLEIILCFVEILQFKQQYKAKCCMYDMDLNKYDVEYMKEYIDITFDDSNSSYIVQSNMNTINGNNCIEIGQKTITLLYEKYIKITSELVVTLSETYRIELAEKIENINEKKELSEIYQYFDDVLSEIYLCLDQSYQRFLRSDKFNKIASDLFIPGSNISTGCTCMFYVNK